MQLQLQAKQTSKQTIKNKNNTKNEKKSLNIGAGNFESIPYRRFLPYYFFKAVYYFVWIINLNLLFKPSIYGHTHFLLQSQKGIFGSLPYIWSRVVPDESRRNLRLRSISCICHENYRAPTREIQTQIMLHLASPSWWRLVMWKRARRIRHLNANMEFYIDKSFISLRKTMKIYKNIYGEFIE